MPRMPKAYRQGISLAGIGTLLLISLAISPVVSTRILPITLQERIITYSSTIEVHADGSLDVVERITVHAEGKKIRRGIYRDFPSRFEDQFGNPMEVGLEVLSVQRDDVPEPWSTEATGTGVRVNIGDDSFLPVPANYTYTLHYRTARQVRSFQDHDEVYWNAIGSGWAFPIQTGTVVVRLPSPVPIVRLGADGYREPRGPKSNVYVAQIVGPGLVHYRLKEDIQHAEGLTIAVSFPKGVVNEAVQPRLQAQNRGEEIDAKEYRTNTRLWLVAPTGIPSQIPHAKSMASLVRTFGRRNVKAARVDVGEGYTADGAFIFANDSIRRLEIVWEPRPNARCTITVRVTGSRSLWAISPAITLGTTLLEIERLNQRPFRFTGFGWDYGGTITAWNGGRLAKLATQRPRVFLRLALGEQMQTVPKQLLGEAQFSSVLPLARRLNPSVYMMVVRYEEDATCDSLRGD